jgi:hypothetical protein
MVLQIAPPSRFSWRKLARIFEHEMQHARGKEHEDMTERDYWSKGKAPAWAKGSKLSYRGRAPSLLPKE